MSSLALHIDHRVAPGADEAVATQVAVILVRPCFHDLVRVAINVKDRDKAHQAKTSNGDAVVLDNGREGELVASARIWTGRHIETYDEPKPFLASYIVVPYESAQREALVDAFVDLVAALRAVAGYVTIERDFAHARDAALSAAPRKDEVRDFPRRAQERKGHYWYDKRVNTELSGPNWGVVLGPDHLKRVGPDPSVFPIIRGAGASKVALLSPDPEDALHDAFDARLEAARKALAPLLMDVSNVPVT